MFCWVVFVFRSFLIAQPENFLAHRGGKDMKCFGYDFIKRRKNHKTYEGHLENLLKRYCINCVLDVGANRGQYGHLLRRVGFKGRIISFEPVRKTYEELILATASDHLWDVHLLALGSKNSLMKIKVMKNSDLSSFLDPNDRLRDMFSGNEGDRVDYEETVSVKRLDDVFNEAIEPSLQSPLRLALKMDTQGYDLEVLHGAEKTLEKTSILQSEIANIQLYSGAPSLTTSLNMFFEKGFEITGIFPESRDMNDFRVIEFNCLLVQKNLL